MVAGFSKHSTWSQRAAFCCLTLIVGIILCSLVLYNVDPANNNIANSDDVIRGYLLLNFFFYSNSTVLFVSTFYLISDFFYSRVRNNNFRNDLVFRLLTFLSSLFLFIFFSIATAFQILPTITVNCADASWINFAANNLAVTATCTQSCSVPVWWVSAIRFLLLIIIVGSILANLISVALHHKRTKK